MSAEEPGAQQWFSEIRRRRPPTAPVEPHTRHPGWQAEERMFESGQQIRPSMPDVPAQGPRNPSARPTRDLREQMASYNTAGNVLDRSAADSRGQTAS